jgi:exosortase A
MTLGVGLVLLLALFEAEVRAAVDVWYSSTAFGHCFLVLPICAWLVWERRERLARLVPCSMPVAALLMLPCAAVWLFAERLGIMEGRQLALLVMLWVMVLAVLGPKAMRAFIVPLAYLVFLVPFGAFLVPALQNFTAQFVDYGLGFFGIPHYVDSVNIEIPEGRFLVAEACAGLRFLIAAIAFGALYAASIYRSPGRRVIFVIISIIVPIVANGIRALGIVMLGHVLGSAEAGAVDHVLYGWIFFSLVILLLVVLGLPFREDQTQPMAQPASQPVSSPRGFVTATALTLLLGCLAPAASWALNRRAFEEIPAVTSPAVLAQMTAPIGCQALPGGTETERSFTCGAAAIHVRLQLLGPHAGGSLVMSGFRAAESTIDAEDVVHTTLTQDGSVWRFTSSVQPEAAAAFAVWLSGKASPGSLKDRLALGWDSLVGAPIPPSVVIVTGTGRGAQVATREMARQVQTAIGPDLTRR